MNDIVTRLRKWSISTDAVPASDLMDEAADEIERRRSRPCPYVTGGTTKYCTLTPLTLTDEERDVLREVCRVYADEDDAGCNEIAFVIDRMLERLRTNHPEKPDSSTLTAEKREPVAWVAFATDGSESRYVSESQEQARSVADDYNWCIAPLFAGLTDAEREAVEVAAAAYADDHGEKFAATLRGLLERMK